MRRSIFRVWIFAMCALPALAETAILECVADAGSDLAGAGINTRAREVKLPGILLASFRSWNVTRWRVDSATLLIHIAKGAPPPAVEIAAIGQRWGEIEPPRLDPKLKFVPQKVAIEPQEWISIEVPPAIVEDMAATRAHGVIVRLKAGPDLAIHTRESAAFSPYLIVTGNPR